MFGLLTRREMMAGAAAVGFAIGLNPGRALAGTPQVLNQTSGMVLDNFFTAITSAKPGDVLVVSGRHTGQFSLDKSLILRGDGSAVIDAGGQGTALVVTADHVQLERLVITGSGQTNGYRTIWGDAGLRVEASRVRLDGIEVTGNDDGIVVLGGEHVRLTGVQVSDNRGAGVKLLGGAAHRIENCDINGNRAGVMVDALYDKGRLRETIVPSMTDRAAQAELTRVKDTAEFARRHVISDNRLHGNETFGVHLGWKTRDVEVARNDIWETGVARPVSEDALRYWEALMSAALATEVKFGGEMLGTGLMITCLPENNRLIDNISRDNRAWGLGISEARANTARGNRLTGNRAGLVIEHADENVVEANVVAENADYGIRVDVLMTSVPTANPATGNLFVRNDLSGNGINAYDSSDTVLTVADFERFVDDMPFPAALRDQMSANPQLRRTIVDQMAGRHAPGHNRWDDGTLGNHYDDFDEPPEGFRDANGDGVGEAAHPIPGGGHVDRHPLTAARVAAI